MLAVGYQNIVMVNFVHLIVVRMRIEVSKVQAQPAKNSCLACQTNVAVVFVQHKMVRNELLTYQRIVDS